MVFLARHYLVTPQRLLKKKCTPCHGFLLLSFLLFFLSLSSPFCAKKGPTLNIGFGGAFFNIVSPCCLQYILRDNFENYQKGKLSRSFKELMGESTFNTDGLKWKFHRKITVALLHRQTVEYAAIILGKKLNQLEQIIRDKDDTIFDFQKIMYSLTMDVFVKIGFGIELNGLGNPKYAPFIEALDELNVHIHERFNDLFWEFKQRFGIGTREKRVKKLTKVIDQFADEIIDAVVKANQNETFDNNNNNNSNNNSCESGRRSNIVSQYIASCQQQNLPYPTNRELRDIVIGFVFAGRDSTSVAMTWTLYELTKHPNVVFKIRQEFKEMSPGGQQERLTYTMIQNMSYLHAVVLESLRLHPSAPESYRFAIKDDILPDGTFIPSGSLVMYSINTINHSTKVWGRDDDDDPETFQPERFLNKKEPSPFDFPTFNGGPRTCPGKSLALMEIKMCIAFLIQRFDFDNVHNHDGSYHWTTVMAMKGGFHVRAKPL